MNELEKTPLEIQSAILQIVQRTDIDPERLEKFLDLQFKAEAKQAATAFQQALAGFQGDCPIIVRTKKINFTSKTGNTTKYNYSPLDEIVHVIKPILTKWGFSYTFDIKTTQDPQTNELVTKIYHSQGHSEFFVLLQQSPRRSTNEFKPASQISHHLRQTCSTRKRFRHCNRRRRRRRKTSQ